MAWRPRSGSSTLTGWKRRSSAASFSKYFLYSVHVVAAIVRSSPRASAGLSRFAASPPPCGAAGADDGVRLVDEEDDRLRRALHLGDDLLQAVLELALHARAGLEEAEVERPGSTSLQERRHVVLGDEEREALDERRLADAGVADDDRVVLPAAHEDVDDLTNLPLAAEDRIDLARRARSVKSTQNLESASCRPRAAGAASWPLDAVGSVDASRLRPSAPRAIPPVIPGQPLDEIVGRDLQELSRDGGQRVPEVARLRHADEQMAHADARLIELQARVEPALLDRLLDLNGEIAHRGRPPRQPIERLEQVARQLGGVELVVADDAVQVRVRLLQELVHPVRELDVGVPRILQKTVALSSARYASSSSFPNSATRLMSAMAISSSLTWWWRLLHVVFQRGRSEASSRGRGDVAPDGYARNLGSTTSPLELRRLPKPGHPSPCAPRGRGASGGRVGAEDETNSHSHSSFV